MSDDYATQAVYNWLSNDEASYHATNEIAERACALALADPHTDDYAARVDLARYKFAQDLRQDLTDEQYPDGLGGLYGDLLTWALNAVDWRAFAERWLDDDLLGEYMPDDEREPTDDEQANRYGVEGGIAYATPSDEQQAEWRRLK